MLRYDDWSKERLAWKCRELEREIEQLKNELQGCKDEKDHLQFVIDNELEPRLKAERQSYDAEGNGMYRVDNWEEIYKLIHSLIGEPYEN